MEAGECKLTGECLSSLGLRASQDGQDLARLYAADKHLSVCKAGQDLF